MSKASNSTGGHPGEPPPPGRPADANTHADGWILALLDAHETSLLRYALSLTGNLEAARDVVQDAFVRLCQQDEANRPENPVPWLFTVCRHRALDRHRKENRMTALTESELAERPHTDPDPAQRAEIRDSTQRLTHMLDRLPENQREVVRLKFQQQLSYQEISSVTGLSVTNVGFILHTALKTLRLQMQRLEQPLRAR